MWWCVNTIKLKVTVVVEDGNNMFRSTVYVDTGKTGEDKGKMTLAQWQEHVRGVRDSWELANVSILHEGEVYG